MLSTHILHTFYTIFAQYLNTFYTIFAQYLHTAILGRFHDGELVDGVAAVLAGVRVEEDIAVNIFDIYATNI